MPAGLQAGGTILKIETPDSRRSRLVTLRSWEGFTNAQGHVQGFGRSPIKAPSSSSAPRANRISPLAEMLDRVEVRSIQQSAVAVPCSLAEPMNRIVEGAGREAVHALDLQRVPQELIGASLIVEPVTPDRRVQPIVYYCGPTAVTVRVQHRQVAKQSWDGRKVRPEAHGYVNCTEQGIAPNQRGGDNPHARFGIIRNEQPPQKHASRQ